MDESEHIGFNKPYLTGKETTYIEEAVRNKKLSGDGAFTKKCHAWFEQRYGFRKTLLTTSCTDALEMAALLLDIQPGDEVIAPAYTFVSTVNAFVLRGAKIVFADSTAEHPNIDPAQVEALVSAKTKAIIPVHYAGVACDMGRIGAAAAKYNIPVVEDAAQAIDSFYNGKPLGSIGALAAFSFHETKNIISGEGGLLAINDERFVKRAEIIREKGTNRSAFFRGEVDKYGWVDIGSSFLPSEIIAAFLYAQLEQVERIQQKRLHIWNQYHAAFATLEQQGKIKRPFIPAWATNNAHMYYLVCNSVEERSGLIEHLKSKNIQAVFHYLSLHNSPYYKEKHDGRPMPVSDHYTDCLLRLPMYYELTESETARVCDAVNAYFSK